MLYSSLLLGFASVVLGSSSCKAASTTSLDDNTTPPSGALVVGGNGTYTTVQSAVDALTDSTSEQVIFINAGTYEEQVMVSELSGSLTIMGYTTDSSSYKNNVVNITFAGSQETNATNDETATLSVHTPNFKLYNVNVINSFGEGSQAVALSSEATNQGYYGVGLYGFQDTLLANVGDQIFAGGLISGATDFIFGMSASVWFDNIDIAVVPTSLGYITASGRSSDDANWYVFNNCTIAALDGEDVTAGVYYLGRPWRDYARVVYQFTDMSNVVNSAGWHIWNTGDELTDHVYYGEYENTGAGSDGTRASFSQGELSAAIDITTVLGSDYASAFYVDADYLS